MEKLDTNSLRTVLNKISIETSVKYIPFGDGEQNYSIFYKNTYPYILVNKEWNHIFSYQKSKL